MKGLRNKSKEYEYIKRIGRGSIAEIWLAKRKETGQPCVVKQMKKQDLLGRGAGVCFREEFDCLVAAATGGSSAGPDEPPRRAPGIAALQHVFHDDEHVCFVMDYYPGGDLLGLMGKYECGFPEPMVQFYIAEAAAALHVLHGLGFVHRDIRSDNLLLDARGHLYIADFGSCARVLPDVSISQPLSGGSPEYMSPELLATMQGDQNARYSFDTDWWSLGVVMYEVRIAARCAGHCRARRLSVVPSSLTRARARR